MSDLEIFKPQTYFITNNFYIDGDLKEITLYFNRKHQIADIDMSSYLTNEESNIYNI